MRSNKYVRIGVYILLAIVALAITYKGGKDFARDFLFDWINS